MTAGGCQDTAMIDQNLVVHRDPEILGGTPVFVGTRVPVKNLFDYLEAGDSLDVFLDEFPSVTRAQAVAALELAREALVADDESMVRTPELELKLSLPDQLANQAKEAGLLTAESIERLVRDAIRKAAAQR